MFANSPYYPASSSPPSSPGTYFDSSPPSSPAPSNERLEYAPIVTDPFAGSVKAVRNPRLYDRDRKRTCSSTSDFILSTPVPKKSRRDDQADGIGLYSAGYKMNSSDVSLTSTLPADEETMVWDKASQDMYENSHGALDLSGRNLKEIPPSFILDISKFFVIPQTQELDHGDTAVLMRHLRRTSSAPASARRVHSLSRTASMAATLPRHDISLFLNGNCFTTIPIEVFSLEKLTVLSLRANNISYIPPEICQLTNLKDLNIAMNQIKYLPAEMLTMNLHNFYCFPNPFYVDDERHQIIPPSRVPYLVELVLRKALSPSDKGKPLLKSYYQLPLPELAMEVSSAVTSSNGLLSFEAPLPAALHHVVDVCCPESVWSDEYCPDGTAIASRYVLPNTSDTDKYRAPYKSVSGLGTCPSPEHAVPAFFIVPMEERFQWVKSIGGVDIGGKVPVKWRGCSSGCLKFLDREEGIAEESDEEDIAQPLTFRRGEFTEEDFE